MCGRLPVVKGFLNVDARAGRSCHVFGLFARPYSMAAGHNALRRSGPGQKHALKRRTGTFGLSRSVSRLAWVRYSFIALSNFVSGEPFLAFSCCFSILGSALTVGTFHCAPSWPMRSGRSCWPGRRPRSWSFAAPTARPARDAACNPAAWHAG